jgi:two-component sensor histidine kinase
MNGYYGATWKRFFLNRWVLASVPAVIIFTLLPKITSRYSLDKTEIPHVNEWMTYEDLNNDGESERIIAWNDTPFNPVGILDQQGRWYDQWNIRETLIRNISQPYFGDYDQDGMKEIYVLSVKDDSLFLNINEFFDPNGFQLRKHFITTLGLVEGHVETTTAAMIGFFDQDGDGMKEFYFNVQSGFGLWPRLYYTFNLVNKKIRTSPYTSINMVHPQMVDSDSDGNPELIAESYASGNQKTPTPYSDRSAWFMVYDEQLNFEFTPVEFRGFGAGINVKPFNTGSGYLYIINLIAQGALGDTARLKSQLMVFSPDGNLIRKRPTAELGAEGHVYMEVIRSNGQDKIVILTDPIRILNEELQVEKLVSLPHSGQVLPKLADVDGDGILQLTLIFNQDKKIIFFDNNFEPVGELTLKKEYENEIEYSSIITKRDKPALFVKADHEAYLLRLTENPYYLLNYLVYPLVYLGFVGFIVVIQKAQTVQVEKRELKRRRIKELQLRSIKGQLDPHFTFNALNAIGSMLQLEDRNTAYDYLSKFTRLLRQVINDSERIHRGLEEELEFVETYLKLEKIRFEDKFNYTIHVDDLVTRAEPVPIMCIQIFVENSLRHGIMPMQSGGRINIDISRDHEYLTIKIQDNGVGRYIASQANPNHGRGLKMTTEFYEILNQFNPKPISFEIHDLHEKGRPSGTLVEVKIPVYEQSDTLNAPIANV